MLGAVGDSLCMCDWVSGPRYPGNCQRLQRFFRAVFVDAPSPVCIEAARQLDEYLAGHRHEFSIPLALGGTDFQIRVWQQLLTIGYGSTITYGRLAHDAGCPAGVQAIAGAVARNAISIFVPCHRVVAANGIGGYDGGIDAKLHLLSLEASPLPL